MAKHQILFHRSPTTEELGDRLNQGNLKTKLSRENVALGKGPTQIHHNLMQSPGHRANLMASDISHVGIGLQVHSSGIWVTQIFFTPQPTP